MNTILLKNRLNEVHNECDEQLNEAYHKVAEESRKIDKKKLKWAEMSPNIHGVKRIKLIPWWSYNESWFVRPLVIKRR